MSIQWNGGSIEAALFPQVRDTVAARLREIRCPEHGSVPTSVTVTGPDLDTLSWEIRGPAPDPAQARDHGPLLAHVVPHPRASDDVSVLHTAPLARRYDGRHRPCLEWVGRQETLARRCQRPLPVSALEAEIRSQEHRLVPLHVTNAPC
jgi:hypothetical protein